MTGTDRIKAKILEDSKKIADENLSKARQEAQRLVTEAQKEALVRTEKARQAALDEASNLKKRMIAVASLEERKRMLKVRQSMVNAAFKTAFEKVVKLPVEEYGQFLKGIIIDSVRKGEGEILFNETDQSRLGSQYIEEINKMLKAEGKASELRLSKDTIPNRGGFVLKYGEMEINCTLEIMFDMNIPKLEAEVASILFKA